MTGDYVTGEQRPGSHLDAPESASDPEVGTERGSGGRSGPQAGAQGFHEPPEPLRIPRDAAEMLHSILGKLLGDTAPDGGLLDDPDPDARLVEYAEALHRYDHKHGLTGNDIPGHHHYGAAGTVLTIADRERERIVRDRDRWKWYAEDRERQTGIQRRRATQAEELLDVAHQTSNRSEAERARAELSARAANAALGEATQNLRNNASALHQAHSKLEALKGAHIALASQAGKDQAALNRVRDVAADMHGITGARTWAQALDAALGGDAADYRPAIRALAEAVRESLARLGLPYSPEDGAALVADIATHLGWCTPEPPLAGEPPAEELVQVGWYCWRCRNFVARACRSDNVPVHVPREWAEEMGAEVQRIEDGDQPKIVVLCGSTRFMRAMDEADDALTCAGRIVVRPSLDLKAGRPAWVETDAECEALVQRLHEVHRAKIRMADRVLIVGNYMGESTRGEYEYAVALGKPVDFTHPEIDPARNGEAP